MDASSQFEGCGIEFKDRDVGEGVLVGVKKLVVIDIVVLAEDPLAIRTQIGLRGLSLDLVAECFLALVGGWDVVLVEEKQARADNGGDDKYGEDHAVDAGSGGLHGGDLVRLLQQADGGEHG